MIEEIRGTEGRQLTVRRGEMVFDIPSEQEIVSVSDPHSPDAAAPINLGGAWRDLVDGEAMLEALDRMGRESAPSPPIIAID